MFDTHNQIYSCFNKLRRLVADSCQFLLAGFAPCLQGRACAAPGILPFVALPFLKTTYSTERRQTPLAGAIARALRSDGIYFGVVRPGNRVAVRGISTNQGGRR